MDFPSIADDISELFDSRNKIIRQTDRLIDRRRGRVSERERGERERGCSVVCSRINTASWCRRLGSRLAGERATNAALYTSYPSVRPSVRRSCVAPLARAYVHVRRAGGSLIRCRYHSTGTGRRAASVSLGTRLVPYYNYCTTHRTLCHSGTCHASRRLVDG